MTIDQQIDAARELIARLEGLRGDCGVLTDCRIQRQAAMADISNAIAWLTAGATALVLLRAQAEEVASGR